MAALFVVLLAVAVAFLTVVLIRWSNQPKDQGGEKRPRSPKR